MRRLHLDYHAPARMSRAGVFVLGAGIFAAAAALWQFERLRQEHAAVDAELALARSRLERRAPAAGGRTEGARFAQEAAAANAVIRRISFPWGEVFGAFEAVSNDEVALVGIEPDAGKGLVTVTAEARTPRGMLQYVKRLQRTALLEQVVLQKHEIQAEDPQRPVRFTVVAKWKERD